MKRKFLKPLVCILLAVSMLLAPLSAMAASSKAYIMRVNVSGARLHSSTDADHTIVAKLSKGSKVLYWGSKNGAMYKVVTLSGKTGYVYKNYLSVYGAVKKSSVYVTRAKTKLYKRSGSSLKGNGTLSAGKYVVVYRTYGNWAYVKTMSGKGAYVNKNYLKKAF